MQQTYKRTHATRKKHKNHRPGGLQIASIVLGSVIFLCCAAFGVYLIYFGGVRTRSVSCAVHYALRKQ